MSYSNPLVYNDANFRAMFPFFVSTITYPTASLQNWFTMGTSYVSDVNCGYMIDAARQQALYLMTAHLAALNDIIVANAGSVPTLVKDAAIDKVHVGLEMPPTKTQFQWWLNLTPWGAQLLTLLNIQSAGGWIIGGLPERAAFRRVAGGFGGPWGVQGFRR